MFFKNEQGKKEVTQLEQPGRVRTVPLIPLRDVVVFPHMVIPLYVGRERSIAALDEAVNKEKDIFLASQKTAKTNEPSEEDIFTIGTLGTILHLLKLPDGTEKILVEGKKRGRIIRYIPNDNFFLVEVEEIIDTIETDLEVEALMRSLITTFESYSKINPRIPPEMLVSISNIDNPSRLADAVVIHLNIKIEERQKILEIFEPKKRLEKVLEHLQGEIEILEVERKIKTRVKKQMEKTQKEYFLNEQMKAIQKELGEKDEFRSEIQELEERLKQRQKFMSQEAIKKVKKEIKKLKLMPAMSAEVTVVRNYIDWILSLPWGEKTEEKLDIKEAEKILEEDHYGLRQPKERILEYLAVRSLVKKMKGQILCFVGPPGVGKTSLAKSIARATGRKFVRLSLGGVRDEAEIRGHRRTYIGALPGKIIQSMKKAGSNNPVFLMDEVDKMSMDFRGDPSAALLEVLDPEQNHAFNDHYMDLDYDLSDVMFITTANTLHPIQPALQDRMEVIRLPGYTELEKLHIARKFLIPKQMEAHGLKDRKVILTRKALLEIVRQYTKEAGVRNLEREITTINRKIAKKIAKKGLDKEWKFLITSENIQRFLGVPKFRFGRPEEKDKIGVCTGLAWTEFGGELLATEITVMPGKGKLIVTGKLGDVMQESAQAAMSYVRSRADDLGLEREFYQKVDIHIHIPEGAIPKDGPSAGITMATAIVSALAKIPVKKDVAMTGEITLRGRVLPVGGLKEKLLAAHRGLIKEVIISRENEKDLKDVPKKIVKDVKVILVDSMDEVLAHAFVLDAPDMLWKGKGAGVPSGVPSQLPPEPEKPPEVVTH